MWLDGNLINQFICIWEELGVMSVEGEISKVKFLVSDLDLDGREHAFANGYFSPIAVEEEDRFSLGEARPPGLAVDSVCDRPRLGAVAVDSFSDCPRSNNSISSCFAGCVQAICSNVLSVVSPAAVGRPLSTSVPIDARGK